MIKKFLSGSGIFALSVLVFSFVRQIVVFPAVSRYSDDLFIGLTFMIFTFEAIAYGFTGAIPDYYVRRVHGGAVDAELIHKLGRFSLISFVSLAAFLMLGMGTSVSLLLSVYLYLFALNALKIKIVFNKMRFAENFVYMAFRSAPYLLVLWGIQSNVVWARGVEIECMAGLLLAFECIYWIRLNAITHEDMVIAARAESGNQRSEVQFFSILPFVASALLMGFIQRGDLTLMKVLDTDYYVGYAKLILTVNFFCAPLSLMVSSPLLSFMSRYGLSLGSKEIRHILIWVAALIAVTGLGSVVVFRWMHSILYHEVYGGQMWLVFYFTTTALAYSVVRTLVVKYANIRFALHASSLVLVASVGMAFLAPVAWVPIVFYAIRFLFLCAILIIPTRHK
ncbi:hypothetical protein RM530_03155 [Algiphilus sp. W345]|uniref:Polysaccharide biosynthesis protein n=1 Tax=Banduia mediterranea TaxID=3075609 RepID=A0ABU2WGH4_9GAMM|nr:hypothetical protein [Algiphilus sp. W345]MDT0496366.1 hypothetical protein [Algiphilus sp. W345]